MALWSWISPYYFCRFIEALRAQVKERMSQAKLELPPLCCCASSFWDSHPDTCANNCVFYNNPKGEDFTPNHLLAYWASVQLHENIFFLFCSVWPGPTFSVGEFGFAVKGSWCLRKGPVSDFGKSCVRFLAYIQITALTQHRGVQDMLSLHNKRDLYVWVYCCLPEVKSYISRSSTSGSRMMLLLWNISMF